MLSLLHRHLSAAVVLDSPSFRSDPLSTGGTRKQQSDLLSCFRTVKVNGSRAKFPYYSLQAYVSVQLHARHVAWTNEKRAFEYSGAHGLGESQVHKQMIVW